jgi:hypothetical protein
LLVGSADALGWVATSVVRWATWPISGGLGFTESDALDSAKGVVDGGDDEERETGDEGEDG